ncbi:MAG: hypothetical protein CVU51_03585 [Deltaproteobacteria bacterium HGW-Deltaproteobacteria-1]|nr:MAG: hypothetical protein CVU51_03585 [Deltaproteobacteria bacterium HGW-Deltaproteobacteria-1]
MSKVNAALQQFQEAEGYWVPKTPGEISEILGVKYDRLGLNTGSLPFAPPDATAGSESELQTVVVGNKNDVDLPLFIEQSSYFANTKRRTRTGETSRKVMTDLEKHLNANREGIWENSLVRFPRDKMGELATAIFQYDLMADKANVLAGQRSDLSRFIFQQDGCDHIRIPISYLLKLSLAEIVDPKSNGHPLLQQTGLRVMENFLNDNTSPETSSFYVVTAETGAGLGRTVAREMAIRFLLSQFLVQYANKKYALEENGQKAMIFLSPHPPTRQKDLSCCISDAFYRELFMNPCLSGWDKGEEKHEYMHLCHRVLSRSQFNAVLKLREAGIITSNLVSLPNLSNISLANNGTHVSLGSTKLGCLLKDSSSGFSARDEKYIGDLVVKIVEHFLPLFVGTYSAAPYRLDFVDFHPEKALGFLPHELDYTHLRMLWRRWRKKADLSVFGKSITPFGPRWIDHLISEVFRLKGDFIPDFRLIDYLVVLMSTDESPALNGELNNSRHLKTDLADLGVFDAKMSLYLLEKLREYSVMGFSGFEGRHYSLFENFMQDVGPAVNLQNLLYLLAFKYIVTGQVGHEHIPDDPSVESERRQIFFGSAIGLPTFFVQSSTGNTLLKKIISRTERVRMSRRYPGYLRAYNLEYRRALLKILHEDAADLIEMLGMRDDLVDLEDRLNYPEGFSACGRLTRGVLNTVGARSPLEVSAATFNQEAEKYYRTDLRNHHILEAFALLGDDMGKLEKASDECGQVARTLLYGIFKGKTTGEFLEDARHEILSETASVRTLETIINMILVHIHHKTEHHRMS